MIRFLNNNHKNNNNSLLLMEYLLYSKHFALTKNTDNRSYGIIPTDIIPRH